MAIDVACNAGMAMEFEADEAALSTAEQPKASRMRSYIERFKSRGVFDSASVAYYTGSHLLLDMSRSHNAADKALADSLAAIIVSRPKR